MTLMSLLIISLVMGWVWLIASHMAWQTNDNHNNYHKWVVADGQVPMTNVSIITSGGRAGDNDNHINYYLLVVDAAEFKIFKRISQLDPPCSVSIQHWSAITYARRYIGEFLREDAVYSSELLFYTVACRVSTKNKKSHDANRCEGSLIPDLNFKSSDRTWCEIFMIWFWRGWGSINSCQTCLIVQHPLVQVVRS